MNIKKGEINFTSLNFLYFIIKKIELIEIIERNKSAANFEIKIIDGVKKNKNNNIFLK